MICPSCHAEYRDGFTRCADCEIPLVESLEDAGRGAAGEELEEGPGFSVPGGAGFDGPRGLSPLAELGSPELLGTLLEQLEEAQVPYVVQAGTALALTSGKELESDGFPDPWGARVLVVGSFKPQARAMLDAIVAEAKQRALLERSGSPQGPVL
jgi:hypothetical protein